MAPPRKAKPASKPAKPTPKRRSSKRTPEATVEPPQLVAPAPPPAAPAPAPARRNYWGWFVLALSALALAAAIVAVFRFRDGDHALKPKLGVPTAASVSQLHDFASGRQTVFWAGPPEEGKIELTKTRSGAVYIRYLTRGAKIGDPTARYTTIGTYSMQAAYAALQQSARSKGAVAFKAANEAFALWRRARPTSIYLAYRGTPYLVEIYDPNPRRARSLAKSGKINRVS
jgi:hypothetical protein